MLYGTLHVVRTYGRYVPRVGTGEWAARSSNTSTFVRSVHVGAGELSEIESPRGSMLECLNHPLGGDDPT